MNDECLERRSFENLVTFYREELSLIAERKTKATDLFTATERNHLKRYGVLIHKGNRAGGRFNFVTDEALEVLDL